MSFGSIPALSRMPFWQKLNGLGGTIQLRRATPPHPSPLARGQGERSTRLFTSPFSTAVDATPHIVPSPWGEGQGEGDHDDRRRKPFDRIPNSIESFRLRSNGLGFWPKQESDVAVGKGFAENHPHARARTPPVFRIIIVRRKRNDADARAFAESFFVEKTRAPSVGPDRDQINHRVRNTVL